MSAMNVNLKQLTVWRELVVGPIVDPERTIRELEADCYVSDAANDIMQKPAFKTLTAPKRLKLAKVTVRDLGFTESPTTDELWARIGQLGGELCPPEVGPSLRKEDKDQPNGSAYWLAMKQITDSDGDPYIFGFRCFDDGRRSLRGYYALPDGRWDLDGEIVFVLRE